MDRILAVLGWVAVVVTSLVIGLVFPEARTIIACLLTATLIFYVFFAAVKLTVARILGDQLTDLRLEINAMAERLDYIDRKTNALFLDALAQRQAAGLRGAARVAPRQTLSMHRRSA